MYKCDVYIDGKENPYQGQYEIDEEFLEVEIFNYHSSSNDTVPIGSAVKYKDITKKFSPITYDPVHHTYRKPGDVVGKAFSDGLKLK